MGLKDGAGLEQWEIAVTKKIVSEFKGTLWALLREMRMTFARRILQGCGPPDDCRWSAAVGKAFAL